VLSDPGRAAARAYGALQAGGRLARRRTVYIGRTGKILLIDDRVAPRTAGADIARRLAELGIPRR